MFLFKKKLNQRYKILAVQLTREYFVKSDGDIVELEYLIRSDARIKVINSATIALFIQVAFTVFEYLRNQPASVASDLPETDIEMYANSLRYEE